MPATLVRKINRFIAEVNLNGSVCLAHIPSSGRMTELLKPSAPVLLLPAALDSTRQTAFTLAAVYTGSLWVSVDSTLPNRLVGQLLCEQRLPELSDYKMVKREHNLGSSRFDFLLRRGETECLMEVKSVTFVDKGAAMFPDAPTLRGRRHLEELAASLRIGYSAVVLFVVQRADAQFFQPYAHIDPEFADTLRDVQSLGVRVLAYKCDVNDLGVVMKSSIPVRL